MSVVTPEEIELVRERIREDTPFWAERFAKIIDKRRRLVPLVPNEGQLELDRLIEAQRAAGKPMRVIILKARQAGFSTWTQAKLIHRATQRPHRAVMTVANDRELGKKLYRMGEVMYQNLPGDPDLGIKPPIGQYARGQSLHFGDLTKGSWEAGTAFPNSSYTVDTAKEGNAGRGGTYTDVHASEAAFWPDLDEKLTALLQGVPDDPDTLVVVESTANGQNAFKEMWDRAEAGESEYIAFFWPWWKQTEYRLPFANEAEREAFVIGDGPYGDEEPRLVEVHGLDLEQLHWRRWAIANKTNGDLRMFHQEYPSDPEQAFLSTGKRVFDSFRVKELLDHVEETSDPRVPTDDVPGPLYGELRIESTHTEHGRSGPLEVPDKALWVPWQGGRRDQPWKFWVDPTPPGPGGESPLAGRTFVMVVDPSGGVLDESGDPDYHAIQVIDHSTLEQVAEFHNRSMDPDEVALQTLLAALIFNKPWVAVERTGGWGYPIIRKLRDDYHYPFMYRAKRFATKKEKTEDKIGWDTSARTKPMIIARAQELLRDDEFAGIRSKALAREFDSYVRDEKGNMGAAPGRNDDLLMAWMIAQQVAADQPIRKSGGFANRASRGTSRGLSAYDPR